MTWGNERTKVIKADFIRATQGAMLLVLENSEEIWVPKSVIEWYPDDIEKSEEPVEIEIREWFCNKKGI